MRRIASHLLWTRSAWIKNPIVSVDAATGRILAIDTYDSTAGLDSSAGVEFHAGVLCPSFVNAHCHLELSHLRGRVEGGDGLAAFVAQVGRAGEGITAEERRRAIESADRAMREEGIAAVADHANGDAACAVKRASALRYHTFAEVCGLRRNNMEAARALLAEPDTSLTPHSTYSLPDALFKEVCAVASDAPLSIHLLEDEAELKLYHKVGALHEWYAQMGFECDFLHYGMPVERIVECVPSDRSVMLVHNCYISPIDIFILQNHFTAPIWWVLCPRSNRYISGIEPRTVELLRQSGAQICIGTDSLASNGSLSVVEELKCFQGIPLHELLGWATANGAAALGMDDELGDVAVGRTCGLTLLEGVDMESLTLTEESSARRII